MIIMNNFKVEAVERIIFSLPYEMQPFDVIRDVEKFLGVKNCVMHIVAYLSHKYMLTICSTSAVEKLLCHDKIPIGRRKCDYQVCDKKLSRVKILNPPNYFRSNVIDRAMRRYGNVVYSDIERRANNSYYFAVMDLQKPMPEKIALKRRLFDVVCF